LTLHEDARGALVSIESSVDVPFDIRRVYYLLGRPGSSRGFHAHKTLRQLMVCVAGSCRVVLDDGRSRSDYVLERPDQALLVEAMMWREMHDFAEGTVLLVLASAHYDEADYIRDYDEFLREAGDKGVS
jgi:dTDP-4-dehydrorhamnose 3,5-epimerase